MRTGRVKHKEPNELTPSPFFDKERNTVFAEKSNKPFFNSTTGSNAAPVIQRKCKHCEQEELQAKSEGTVQRQTEETPMAESMTSESVTGMPAAEATADPMAAATEPAEGATASSSSVIVDDASTPGEGQMRRSEFLGALRARVFATATEALSGTPFSGNVSGYIDSYFAQYSGSPASQLERTIRQQEPSAAGAQRASHLIRIVNARVLSEIRSRVPFGGGGGIMQSVGSAVSSAGSAIGDIASGVGNFLFKENSGGAKPATSPSAVMHSLGKGSHLDAGSQSKMESVFGTSFSNVEVHTDSKAAQISGGMNARAFTVGNHVAFASGEHKPGTLIGDALMAHELAHVIQQQGQHDELQSGGHMGYEQFEEDADNSAVSAMLSLKGMNGSLKGLGKKLLPRLKSKLGLQRCDPAPRRRVRYHQYGGTGFNADRPGGGSCLPYCACRTGENGQPVTGGDARIQIDPREFNGRCPAGLIIEWDGMTRVSTTPLDSDPCPGPGSDRGCL